MPETLPFKCAVFIEFSLCFVPVLGGCCKGTLSKVMCEMILRMITISAALVLENNIASDDNFCSFSLR